MDDRLQLLDWRREVAQMYAEVRRGTSSMEDRWRAYRSTREHLFRSHPQSPLSPEQQNTFQQLCYYGYDPGLHFTVPVDLKVEPEIFNLELQDDGLVRMRRFGRIHFSVEGRHVSLSLFWILGYGGGVFLPFRDLTNTDQTYGGGRYLLDTIKHADLGQERDRLVVDFNFAYNPSCAYNPRWHCPLAPVENRLPVAIRAGEQMYSG